MCATAKAAKEDRELEKKITEPRAKSAMKKPAGSDKAMKAVLLLEALAFVAQELFH